MDAGIGTSIGRGSYLEDMWELLWDRDFLDGRFGSKSMDLYLFFDRFFSHLGDGRFASIAELKILRALHQANIIVTLR